MKDMETMIIQKPMLGNLKSLRGCGSAQIGMNENGPEYQIYIQLMISYCCDLLERISFSL